MAAITSAVVMAAGVAVSASNASKANKTAKAANANAAEIQGRQQDIADEQWARYKQDYLPLEQEYLETAKNAGSIANQEKAAANAGAAVAGRFANAREQLAKTPGLNPNSQQYLREANKLAIAEAAASAAGQTAARENTQKTGAAMLQDAAAMGKGQQGNAMNSLNAAANGASGAASAANAGVNQANAGVGGAFQAVGGLYKSGAFNGLTDTISGWTSPTGIPSSVVPQNYTPASPAAMGGGGQMDQLANLGVF